MQVWWLGQEAPLEKEMATHSSILAWRIPQTEETCGLQSMGHESDTMEHLSTWNLEKWYRLAYLQSRARDADVWAPRRVANG